MQVNKVSGNFHVAVGEGVMRDGRHVHQYNLDEAAAFNTSHTIHNLSFGEPYPGMRPNPLDGTKRIIDKGGRSGANFVRDALRNLADFRRKIPSVVYFAARHEVEFVLNEHVSWRDAGLTGSNRRRSQHYYGLTPFSGDGVYV